jgi:ATP-dependent RNA helicase DHR2
MRLHVTTNTIPINILPIVYSKHTVICKVNFASFSNSSIRMPEKVHTKFTGAQAHADVTIKSQESKNNNVGASSNPSISGSSANANSGVKRLRDGSPKKGTVSKFPHGPKADQASQKSKVHNHTSRDSERPQPKKSFIGSSKPKANEGAQNGTNVSRGQINRGIKATGPNQLSDRNNPQVLRKTALALEKTRKELPIWSKKLSIQWALRHHDVLLLNGETGSGKSTQVPQFLYTEPWCKRQKVTVVNKDGNETELTVGGMIAITQPRRVAAMTLADRVAKEMGSPLSKGTEGQVGYAVRFESIVPRGTKIKFLTEGMLLQEMLHDPYLRKYSAVIVDEIHERSVDVDLIAGFLRTILHGDKKGRGGLPLKVVVMSATLDLGGIEAFFAKPKSGSKYKPGKNHGTILAPHLLESEVDGILESDGSRRTSNQSYSSWDGFSDSDSGGKLPKSNNQSRSAGSSTVGTTNKLLGKTKTNDDDSEADEIGSIEDPGIPGVSPNGVAVEYVQGRQYEVEILYEASPSQNYLDNILKTILQLHVKEPLPGDILAFLTGQDEIESLQSQLEGYAEKLVKTVPKMKIMPLYGSLPALAQQEAFEKVKEPFTRKIVLATNIAETSVTVSGVRYVIDCGKSKVKQYRPKLGLESLLAKSISRVSAIQRAGRAGREAKGKCFRVYTEDDYLKLEQDELPEILRSDVVEAVLKMKARGVEDVLTFPLMDSPDLLAMEKALFQLHAMGALDDTGRLTEAGTKMATFPLPAIYGRVILAAADPTADVLLEAIDVISCLTTDSEIYLQPRSDDERETMDESRINLLDRSGDILTMLKTMQYYTAENSDRGEWCKARLISARAMRMAMMIRRQLRQLCISQNLLKFTPAPDPQPYKEISPERAEVLIKTFLTAFCLKTAMLAPDGKYLTTQGRNEVSIHPASVLYGRKAEAIMFLEHVFTARSYGKKVNVIQANWIMEAMELK